MRKTKHNALDENAIYGAPIWKSDGAKGSGFVEDYNRELSPHPSLERIIVKDKKTGRIWR